MTIVKMRIGMLFCVGCVIILFYLSWCWSETTRGDQDFRMLNGGSVMGNRAENGFARAHCRFPYAICLRLTLLY